jgi:nicotinamidase-related amidase
MIKSALLVIDVQKIYTTKESEMFCRDATGTVRRINQLIDAFHAKRLPIVYVRHQHKEDGSDTGRLFDVDGSGTDEFNFVEGTEEVRFDDHLRVVKPMQEVIKNRYSAFKNTRLNEILRGLAAQRVVICGFMTNFCCESTARDALDLDYYVDFIVDATGTPGTDNLDEKAVRSTVSELLAAGFARVFKTASYMKRQL